MSSYFLAFKNKELVSNLQRFSGVSGMWVPSSRGPGSADPVLSLSLTHTHGG